jgi:hypothetical protein
MALILGSAEEAFEAKVHEVRVLERVREIAVRDGSKYSDLIEYWTSTDEFFLAEYLRNIRREGTF